MARRLAGKFHDPIRNAMTSLKALPADLGQTPALAEATQALEEADGLLAKLRSFAHVGRPACVAVQPNAFVEAVLARMRKEASPTLQIQFSPGTGLPEVQLDPAQMEQALTALLQNAGQALGGTGTVQVATGLRLPRSHRPGALPGTPRRRVFFEVRDPGPGIPPGLHKQVFEPFFTTRLEAGRAGLGLAIVREVVEGHNGSVQLESASGRGTVVRLLLPVKD